MKLAAVCALLGLQAPPAPIAEPRPIRPPPRVELPPGPLARAAAALEPAQVPARLSAAAASAAWSEPRTLELWRGALERADRGGDTAAAARADLALLALRQGRGDDAWRHVEACSADPALLAALLPHLLPGIELPAGSGAGGAAPPLADGAILRPAVPPRTRERERGRVERREMRVRGLRVGDAELDLRVAVEHEGVQIDVKHVSGGLARVAIALPAETGFAFASEYVDWFKSEEPGVPHAIEIRPGDEEHTVYGRFELAEVPFPALPRAAPPAAVEHAGLEVRWRAANGGKELAEALARALSGPPLALPVRLRGPADPPGEWSAVAIDLGPEDERSARLAALCAAVERDVLR